MTFDIESIRDRLAIPGHFLSVSEQFALLGEIEDARREADRHRVELGDAWDDGWRCGHGPVGARSQNPFRRDDAVSLPPYYYA